MDPKFFRRYADLITEAEQPEQLDEGMLGNLVQPIKNYLGKLIGNDINKAKAVADRVAGILGKSPNQLSMSDINVANAKKMIAASGVLAQSHPQGNMAEAWSMDQAKDGAEITAFWTGLGGVFGAIGVGNLVIHPTVYATAAAAAAGSAAAGMAMLYGAAVCAIIFGVIAATIIIGDHEDPKEIEKRQAEKAQKMADERAQQQRFHDFFFPRK
jgi:hypothetical protein